jgi:hypothetical protein
MTPNAQVMKEKTEFVGVNSEDSHVSTRPPTQLQVACQKFSPNPKD